MSAPIAQLEEVSVNAWTPLKSMLYDGWLIRMAEGYTKRANAIHPLYPSGRDLAEKIAFCESLYARHGLPTLFKLTKASQPAELDAVLAKRGYAYIPEVSVQTLELVNFERQPSASVQIAAQPSPEWIAAFVRMQGLSGTQAKTLSRMLDNILPERGFASLRVEDDIIACGLGVAQAGFVGLFDIITEARFRKRGYGLQIVESLLRWGKVKGARRAYLQVMLDNAPALHLYEKFGFQESYRYWYRVRALA